MELGVTLMIVAILASVLVPLMRWRLDDARWSEGKAGAGTIATALRAYIAEWGDITRVAALDGSAGGAFELIGITDADLEGKYFHVANYSAAVTAYNPQTGIAAYTVTVTQGDDMSPATKQLNQSGEWADL